MNVNLRDIDREQRHRQKVKRPARPAETYGRIGTAGATGGKRVLIVALNTFATFPTLAIGTLAASLRNRRRYCLRVRICQTIRKESRRRRERRLKGS